MFVNATYFLQMQPKVVCLYVCVYGVVMVPVSSQFINDIFIGFTLSE